MFDIGWTELVVVAVVAILVVGPKQLPGMLRSVGKTIGSVRRMAGDFQRQFNDALKEADLDDITKTVTKFNPTKQIKDSLNPIKQATADVQRDINKGLLKPAAKVEAAAKVETAAKVENKIETIDATPEPAPVVAETKSAKPDASGDA